MLNSLNEAYAAAQRASDDIGQSRNTQLNLLPFVFSQLGVGMDRTANGFENFRYIGTDAQRGMDEAARLAEGSQGAQYANIGYGFDINGNPVELAGSQRNQFLDAQGRSVADAERLRSQAMYDLLNPGGSNQTAMRGVQTEFGNAQSVRDQMLNRLYQDMGRGDSLYNEALGTLRGGQGVQNEALDATRQQLATAQGLQAPALDRLGIARDAAGNYINDPNSRMGQYDSELFRQMDVGRDLQSTVLAQLGYRPDASGNLTFDPNSAPGQITDAYRQLIGQSLGEVGTSQQLRDASLARLGLTQGAGGQWTNDPNSYEMQARGLQGDFLSRAQAAMQGNAPVDPGVERSLAEERRLLEETMIRQMGPGWITTSPGQEALRNYEQRANETRYRVQQDALGLGVNQALGLQGSNLQTLATLYGAGQPVQQAIAGAGGITTAASNATNQTNATNSQIMQALQAGVLNPITTASNVNAQTLAGLYGLTAPALAAASQLGQLGNQNIATNAGAYGALNTMGTQNQQNNQAGMANVGQQGVNAANIAALLNSMGLANTAAYGNVANIGQDAINSRAQGAIGFQNSNANILAGIPAATSSLHNTANNARMMSLAAMYPAASQSLDTSASTDLARLYGSLASVAGGQAQGFADQIFRGDVNRFQTNINNLFWQNLMRSGGQFVGSGMGYGGPNAGGGMGGKGGGGAA